MYCSSHQILPLGAQVNKFEQVSSLGYQMYLVGGGMLYSEVPCLVCVLGGGESLYCEAQCIMDNGDMGPLL